MTSIFIAVELFAIVSIYLAMTLLITDDTGAREQKLMAYFLFGVLIQNVGYLLEVTAGSGDAALAAIKVQYLGSVFVPLCYCWFIYSYCFSKPPQILLNVIGVVDFIVLILVFTMGRQGWYYRATQWMTGEDGHSYLSIEYGPAYLLFIICSCIIPFIATFYTLAKAVLQKPDEASSRKYFVVLILSVIPILALFAYAMKMVKGYDPTPATLGITLAMVVILVWRRRTYDFRRMATDVLLESMGDGVVALDLENRIISYNQAAVGVFPALGECRSGDGIERVENFPREMLEEEANGTFTVNDRIYEGHTKEILYKNKKQGFVVLLLDVTDTRKYIDEIKRVQEQAEKANTAKSEFLANMSHEIRTPMNAIIGLSDIIMEESVGRKMYSYAGDIKSASQNLLAIINDILDLSKVEAGKMELVLSEYHLKATVDEVVHMMDIAASQRGLLMKHEYDETIPCKYNGDEGRIKQILINLLNNAIKFTKEGYVKISVEGMPADAENTEMLIFHVQDTGCGIREEDQEKIFENFKQVDSKRNRTAEGTGLGLSITKQLVHLMGGEISLTSVYGEGTTFTVKIPQEITDRRSIAEVPYVQAVETNRIQMFTAEDYRVLVVDDNLINRKVAESFLDTYLFDLDEAESGPLAIEMVRSKRYDMIFMDHMMPEMDGIEAARIIREECGENGRAPVMIALTANAMEGVREMFLRNGFQDFLSKPLDRKHLNETLLKWIPEDRRVAVNASEQDIPKQGAEKEERFDSIYIEGIDNKAVQKYQSGTVEDYLEILGLYCADGDRKIPLLRELFEKKDAKNYGIEVHGLKSASANVGAMSLSAEAREHEEAANREDWEFITSQFEDLLENYERQLQQIRAFLNKRKADAKGAQADAPKIAEDDLRKKVEEALSLLEKFHSKECAAIVEELLGYSMEEKAEEKLVQVQEQLKLYEDTVAEDLLSELLAELGGNE